jgi:hypothetical protein
LADGAYSEALRLLGRVIVATQPYADQLLVIGGMVPVLYRRAPGFARARLAPPGTLEVDMTVPPRLALVDRPMVELLGDADLKAFEAPGYRGQPGAQAFQDAAYGTTRKARSFVEFLAPMQGRGDKGLLEVQPGLRAEALRYLDILAFEPLVLHASAIPELGVHTPSRLRIPQPALYVAQKILARRSGRHPNKQRKDLAYVFDVAALSQPLWANQGEVVKRAAAEDVAWRRWLARAGRDLRDLFAAPTADGPVHGSRIFRDIMAGAAPSEGEIQALVTRFAEKVFPT